MAHELDNNTTTGQKAVFSVKQSMWHDLGIVLDAEPTFEDAMRKSGADYTVETRAMNFHSPLMGATEVPGFKAVVRTDRDVVLGVVSDKYGVIQNETQFEPLKALVGEGLATLETGGVIREGRQAWMLAKLNREPVAVGRTNAGLPDLVSTYVLATTRHDGSGAAAYSLTNVRVVCANTFDWAAGSFQWRAATRHSRNGENNTRTAAQQMFAQFGERMDKAGAAWLRMRDFKLTRDQFVDAVLDSLAPMPAPEREKDMTRAGWLRAVDRAEVARLKLFGAWTNGIGQTGDGSAWEALNAATEIIDHETDILRRGQGDMVDSMINGWAGRAKRTVADNLMAMVNAK